MVLLQVNLVTQIFKPSDIALPALPALSLYIHLPWCVRKCPYCDFNSHLAPESPFKRVAVVQQKDWESPQGVQAGSLPVELQKRYINALITDLDQQLPKVWGRKLHSIFIGGGTPSLFEPKLIDELLGAVRARLGSPNSGEITLEANPGTFEQERFEGFRQAGVTRLSVGVQSFDSKSLKELGRIHSGDQAEQAIQSALDIFDHVNVDLMYGLPRGRGEVQSIEQALVDVNKAIELAPDHLSLYQLTLEPNTAFEAKPPNLPEGDLLIDIEEAVHLAAHKAGYERYEVSAFAKPNSQSQHNLNYWQFGDYLGIGAGAHAKISFANRIERENRLRNPQAYMQAIEQSQPYFETRELKVADLPFEFMLNALRLIEGVPEHYFVERCGRPLSDLQKPLKQAMQQQLINGQPGRFKATGLGMSFLNDLQQLFLSDS